MEWQAELPRLYRYFFLYFFLCVYIYVWLNLYSWNAHLLKPHYTTIQKSDCLVKNATVFISMILTRDSKNQP